MSHTTVIEESNKKKDQYGQVNFTEYIDFLCRIIYARFAASLDANLLGP